MSPFDAAITFVMTTDLGAAAQFYEQVLQLPLALDQGACRIYRVAAGGYLGVCRRPEPASSEGVILTLVTDDVDAWHERLRRAGVPIEAPPRLHPDYRIYHFFCRDPDGHRVEIQRFEDPRWPPGAAAAD